MYSTVKALITTFKPRLNITKTDKGKVISDPKMIVEHWRKYYEDLYKEDKDKSEEI